MQAFLLFLLVPLVFASNCTQYCSNMTATCTAGNAQFPTPDTSNFCEASCWGYPVMGMPETAGDSYECRVYHVQLAMAPNGAMTHCPHAGFNGGGVCGTRCQAYCDSVLFGCTGANTVFTDSASCLTECQFYPVLGTNPADNTTLPRENTLECRSWHSLFGIGTNATSVHCPHASPIGGGFCGTPCDNYCDSDAGSCNGDLMQWESRTQCLDACATWATTPTSTPSQPVTLGANYACRKYHSIAANASSAAAAYHCIHTGPLGGSGVCGTACEGYCDLLTSSCTGINMTTCLAD